MPGIYEQSCIDYAIHGNPMQDHYDHEENARYDRFDGLREEALACEDWEPTWEDMNSLLRLTAVEN